MVLRYVGLKQGIDIKVGYNILQNFWKKSLKRGE